MSDQMFKPGYEGERPATTLTLPERQQFLPQKPDLVRRIHEAMLSLAAVEGRGSLGISTGGVPRHIVEFADMVGQEQAEPEAARFQPTAAQISAMDPTLRLLEGLLPVYFKVVLLRALHEFAKENGERGDWPWDAIGGYVGKSGRWAEDAYQAAMIQAGRRAGLIPMKSKDHAVLAAACYIPHVGWLTNISTAPEPRQAASNLKTKSPVRIDQAFAVWVAGPPVAKRVSELARQAMKSFSSHGSWYKAHPDFVYEVLLTSAREIKADWLIDEIPLGGRVAA